MTPPVPVVDSMLAISLTWPSTPSPRSGWGLWTWVGIDPGDGWFGVPYGNLYAWLFVTLGFSLLT